MPLFDVDDRAIAALGKPSSRIGHTFERVDTNTSRVIGVNGRVGQDIRPVHSNRPAGGLRTQQIVMGGGKVLNCELSTRDAVLKRL